MSEEEKQAIEQLKSWREYIINHRDSVNKANDIEFYLGTALNLIEKQQKQIKKLNIENQALYEAQNLGDNDLLVRILKEKDKEIEVLEELIGENR